MPSSTESHTVAFKGPRLTTPRLVNNLTFVSRGSDATYTIRLSYSMPSSSVETRVTPHPAENGAIARDSVSLVNATTPHSILLSAENHSPRLSNKSHSIIVWHAFSSRIAFGDHQLRVDVAHEPHNYISHLAFNIIQLFNPEIYFCDT